MFSDSFGCYALPNFFFLNLLSWEIHKILKYSTSVFVMPYFKILTGIFRILIYYYLQFFRSVDLEKLVYELPISSTLR